MRKIDLIVLHCSATRTDRCYTEYDLITDHLRRGGSGAGYHYYIRKDGSIKSLRPVDKSGAHARGYNACLLYTSGYNAHSIGVCYEGGLDTNGHSCDTRTTF